MAEDSPATEVMSPTQAQKVSDEINDFESLKASMLKMMRENQELKEKIATLSPATKTEQTDEFATPTKKSPKEKSPNVEDFLAEIGGEIPSTGTESAPRGSTESAPRGSMESAPQESTEGAPNGMGELPQEFFIGDTSITDEEKRKREKKFEGGEQEVDSEYKEMMKGLVVGLSHLAGIGSKSNEKQYQDPLLMKDVKIPKIPIGEVGKRAMVLENWLTEVKARLQQITDGAEDFFDLVIQSVDEAYKAYNEADLLEKLDIEPQLVQGDFKRIRNQTGPIIREALPQDMKDRLLAENKMQPEHSLFALYRRCAPGGIKERSLLLDDIAKPLLPDEQPPDNFTDGLVKLKDWQSRVDRIKKMKDVALPDSSQMWAAVNMLTSKLIHKDSDLAHRVREAKNTLQIDYKPTFGTVEKMVKFIHSEFEPKADDEWIQQKSRKKKSQEEKEEAARLKALQAQDPKGAKGKGAKGDPKGKGKDPKGTPKGAEIPPVPDGKYSRTPKGAAKGETGRGKQKCIHFDRENGCNQGRMCPYFHPKLDPKEGRCFNCGSSKHVKTECTRPTQSAPYTAQEETSAKTRLKGPVIPAVPAADKIAAFQAQNTTGAAGSTEVQTLSSTVPAEPEPDTEPLSYPEIKFMRDLMKTMQSKGVAPIAKGGKGKVLKACMNKTMAQISQKSKTKSCAIDSGANRPGRFKAEDEPQMKIEIELADGILKEFNVNHAGTVMLEEGSQPIVPGGLLSSLLGCANGYDGRGRFVLQHPVQGKIPTFKEHGIPCVSEAVGHQLIDELETAMIHKMEVKCKKILDSSWESTDEEIDKSLLDLKENDPEVFMMVQMKLLQDVVSDCGNFSSKKAELESGNASISLLEETSQSNLEMTPEQLQMFLLSKCTSCGWKGLPFEEICPVCLTSSLVENDTLNSINTEPEQDVPDLEPICICQTCGTKDADMVCRSCFGIFCECHHDSEAVSELTGCGVSCKGHECQGIQRPNGLQLFVKDQITSSFSLQFPNGPPLHKIKWRTAFDSETGKVLDNTSVCTKDGLPIMTIEDAKSNGFLEFLPNWVQTPLKVTTVLYYVDNLHTRHRLKKKIDTGKLAKSAMKSVQPKDQQQKNIKFSDNVPPQEEEFPLYGRDEAIVIPSSSGSIDCSVVYHALATINWPLNVTRKITEPGVPYYGFVQGLVRDYEGNLRLSRQHKPGSQLCHLILQYAKQVEPDFAFTSIQYNKNAKARLHVDAYNSEQDSLFFEFGTSSGLWVYDPIDGDVEVEVTEQLRGEWGKALPKGSWVKGRVLRWQGRFAGTKPHMTMDAISGGDRYSLVLYSVRGAESMPQMIREQLLAFGFPLGNDEPSVDEDSGNTRISTIFKAKAAPVYQFYSLDGTLLVEGPVATADMWKSLIRELSKVTAIPLVYITLLMNTPDGVKAESPFKIPPDGTKAEIQVTFQPIEDMHTPLINEVMNQWKTAAYITPPPLVTDTEDNDDASSTAQDSISGGEEFEDRSEEEGQMPLFPLLQTFAELEPRAEEEESWIQWFDRVMNVEMIYEDWCELRDFDVDGLGKIQDEMKRLKLDELITAKTARQILEEKGFNGSMNGFRTLEKFLRGLTLEKVTRKKAQQAMRLAKKQYADIVETSCRDAITILKEVVKESPIFREIPQRLRDKIIPQTLKYCEPLPKGAIVFLYDGELDGQSTGEEFKRKNPHLRNRFLLST